MTAEEYVEDESDIRTVSGFADEIRDVLFECLVRITPNFSYRRFVAETKYFYRWTNSKRFTIRLVS